MKKQVVGRFDPWNQALEAGDRVYSTIDGKVFDLYESTGRNKKDAGILSYREPSAQKAGKIAVEIDGVWFWK